MQPYLSFALQSPAATSSNQKSKINNQESKINPSLISWSRLTPGIHRLPRPRLRNTTPGKLVQRYHFHSKLPPAMPVRAAPLTSVASAPPAFQNPKLVPA
jgi:hypothetical protein